MARNTGWRLDPEKWATSSDRREVLENQTERLAALLEDAGIPARQNSDVVAISAVTGIMMPVSAWRPIRFLPSVAARDRRPMLSALRFWIEKVHPRSRYLRYGVITHDGLIQAHGDLRGAIQNTARTVSKWAHEASNKYGITVHFRGSEFTRKTAAERHAEALDDDREFDLDAYPGNPVLYHVHANVLIEPMRLLPKNGEGSWDDFLKWTHKYFGAHWKDNGRVEDVREIVKYVCKPADLLDGERPLDAGEAKWLHESIFRLNLSQPMGAFRTYYRGLADDRKKVVSVRGQDDRPRLQVVAKARRLDHSRRRDDAPQGGGIPENTILGITLPQWRHSPWAEPMLLVQNYQPRAYGRASRERLLEIEWERNVARQAWNASGAPDPATALQVACAWREKGGRGVVTPFRGRGIEAAPAARYSVHTSSLTVRPEGSGRGVEPPPKPPPERPERGGTVLEISNFLHPDVIEADFRGENGRSIGADREGSPATGRRTLSAA